MIVKKFASRQAGQLARDRQLADCRWAVEKDKPHLIDVRDHALRRGRLKSLRRQREARKRIPIKSIGLPCRLVPLAVRISHYLHRHDDAIVTELVTVRDAVIDNFPFRIDREFDRPHQVAFVENLDFIVARILTHQVERTEHGFVLFAGLVPRLDVRKIAPHARPDELSVRLGDMRGVILNFIHATAWLADLFAPVHHLAYFLSGMKQMWLEGPIQLGARPKRKAQSRFLPLVNVIGFKEHIADRQVPILIHVIDKMVYIIRSRFIRMHLRHFEFAGEERHVTTHQLVSHLNREIDGPGVGDAFVFRNAIAAAALIGLPPTTLLCLLRVAVELHPWPDAGNVEFGIELATAGDWSINAKVQPGNPTKDLKVFLVGTERESRDLYRIFGDCRLVLGGRIYSRQQQNDQSKAYERPSRHDVFYQGAPPNFIRDFPWS